MKRIFLCSFIVLGGVLTGCTFPPMTTSVVPVGTGTTITTGKHVTTGAGTNTGTSIVTGSMTGLQTSVTKNYTVDLGATNPYLPFALLSGDTIQLSIQQPSPKTVIRVRQIITPDGKADGPFESNVQYTATQNGTHNFSIGANLMASEHPYTGSVVIKVTLPR